MNKLGRRFWIFLCAFVIFVSIIIVGVACNSDDDCKECTNSKTGDTATYCGVELTEAQLNPNVSCK